MVAKELVIQKVNSIQSINSISVIKYKDSQVLEDIYFSTNYPKSVNRGVIMIIKKY